MEFTLTLEFTFSSQPTYKLVFEYIEAFYNTVRIHSHCDYASPNDYEKKYWIKLRQMEINVA